MTERKFEVLFWGYDPQSGKRKFMEYEGKLFVSLTSADKQHTLTSVVSNAFWGKSQNGLCYQACLPDSRDLDPCCVICKVNVTRARTVRKDVKFNSLKNLKLISGLKQLDREINLDLWAGIAFIEQYQKQHMPK
ncbi:MAG: hypothetical protein ACI9H6_000533 [Patiriisocius sp.]|jgi:hypothetical protein